MSKPDLFLFEDLMDAEHIFTSGLSGRHQHREAYMSCMDFDLMEKFLLRKKDDYTTEQWEWLADTLFTDFGYLSPMNKLVAYEIRRVILKIE